MKTLKKLIGEIFIFAIFILGSCQEDNPQPNQGTTTGGVGTTPATVTAPTTYFISNECYSMNKLGDWWTNGFTLSGTTTFVLRFSSRYKADAAIVEDGQLSNFKNNKAFTGYSIFDDQFGYTTVTLKAGNYSLAIRNQIDGANTVSAELDYAITLPETDRATYYDEYATGVETLNSGAKLWQPFTIEKGARYFIDGCNTGLNCYVIPATELENFKNNASFKYYTDYSDTSCGLPGLDEYKLALGDYYLVFSNTQSITNTVNYSMERWKVN